MLKFFKDLIAPKKCYSCGKEGHFLCEKCFEKIEKHYFFDEICYVCKGYSKNFEIHKDCKKEVFFDKVIILTHYKIKVIKKLILALKFYNKKEIAKDLAEFMSDKFIKYSKKELIENKKEDFIVLNIPTTFLKKILRGYNQTEILAKEFSKNIGLKFEKKVILKIKNTRQQSTLNRQQRLINLNKSFKINKKNIYKVDNKVVILIDDVISTGTTLNEVSKVLKKAGAKKIICVVIASGY